MFEFRVKRTTRHHRDYVRGPTATRFFAVLPTAYGGCLRPADDRPGRSREAWRMENDRIPPHNRGPARPAAATAAPTAPPPPAASAGGRIGEGTGRPVRPAV